MGYFSNLHVPVYIYIYDLRVQIIYETFINQNYQKHIKYNENT